MCPSSPRQRRCLFWLGASLICLVCAGRSQLSLGHRTHLARAVFIAFDSDSYLCMFRQGDRSSVSFLSVCSRLTAVLAHVFVYIRSASHRMGFTHVGWRTTCSDGEKWLSPGSDTSEYPYGSVLRFTVLLLLQDVMAQPRSPFLAMQFLLHCAPEALWTSTMSLRKRSWA